MGNSVYDHFDEHHKFAISFLDKLKRGDIKIVGTPKVTKAKMSMFLSSAIDAIATVRDMWKGAVINEVEEFDEEKKEEEQQFIIPMGDGKQIKILSTAQIKKMEEEITEIEKYYPGEDKLTKEEQYCKGAYKSLHDYQLFIAHVRNGKASIFNNKDGSLSITQME